MVVGKILKARNVKHHFNSDNGLMLAEFNFQQCIGHFIEDELYVFFEAGLKLSEEYCSNNGLFTTYGLYDEDNKLIEQIDHDKEHLYNNKKKISGSGYLEYSKPIIKTQNFRGERSYGLAMPLTSLSYTGIDIDLLKEDLEFTEINEHVICERYISEALRKTNSKVKSNNNVPKIKYPQIKSGWYKEHYDTPKLNDYFKYIQEGNEIVITRKLHGTSGIYSHVPVKINPSFNIYNHENEIDDDYFYMYEEFYEQYEWKHVNGTRRTLLVDKDFGYYGKNDFRKDLTKNIILHKGETLYFEIVGFAGDSNIQKQTVPKELKNIRKLFGDNIIYSYNCPPGKCEIYIYRITLNENGVVKEYTWDEVKQRCFQLNLKHVPEVESFIFDPNIHTFQYFKGLADILIDNNFPDNLNEGIIVKINDKYTYKLKSFWFLGVEHSDKLKNIDLEELESLIGEENE